MATTRCPCKHRRPRRGGRVVSGGVLQLDHVVVAAASLEQGVAWCRTTFGVEPAAGGAHPLMGTHNRVFTIAGPRFARAYFEIIAINPAAAPPGRRRWFDLDDPALQRATAAGPRLVHWVARCADVSAAAASWRAEGFDPGKVVAAERPTPQGVLRWRITVRDDGRRLADGALPTLLQWGDVHPTDALPPSGVSLASVRLAACSLGPAAPALARLVEGSGVEIDPAMRASAPMRIVLDAPRGPVILESLALTT